MQFLNLHYTFRFSGLIRSAYIHTYATLRLYVIGALRRNQCVYIYNYVPLSHSLSHAPG